MRMILLSLMLATVACQRLPLNSKQFRERNIPVGSREEAITKMEAKLSFSSLTFEQFQDHFYLMAKWPTSCLLENKVGTLEKGKHLLAVSKLYLRSDGVAGYCAHHPNTIYSYQVYLHCEGEKFIREITCPVEECEGVIWKSQC